MLCCSEKGVPAPPVPAAPPPSFPKTFRWETEQRAVFIPMSPGAAGAGRAQAAAGGGAGEHEFKGFGAPGCPDAQEEVKPYTWAPFFNLALAPLGLSAASRHRGDSILGGPNSCRVNPL